MTSTSPSRSGGLVLVAGSVAFVIHIVLRSMVTTAADPLVFARAGSWVPINLLGLVGAVLVALGLPVLFSVLVNSAGRSGMIGLALLAVCWLFFGVFLSLYGALVLPWLSQRAPALAAPGAPLPPAFIATFAAALLAWFVGAVLVAVGPRLQPGPRPLARRPRLSWPPRRAAHELA